MTSSPRFTGPVGLAGFADLGSVGPLARVPLLALAVVALSAATGCSSLSAPFNSMKDSQMTVYRLQNFEPPQAPAAAPAPTGGLQLPAQIQQWIQAGASLLPPGLLPPGLLPGTAAPGAAAPDAPRFPPAPAMPNFRIVEWQPVNDPSIKSDIVDLFGRSSNFQQPTSNCMYAELGFAIAQPNSPQPADVLVSLSCQQVQAFNFAWPYQQTGVTPDAEKKFVAIAQRVFAGR
jgi:hypothetical protein